MEKLKTYREQQHITQEELAERSGISVRTIQRIEAGNPPKGYTLKALAKALDIEEQALLPRVKEAKPKVDTILKLINLSSLPFTLIPVLNILAPLLLMLITRRFQTLPKQILAVQITWTILTVFIFLISVLLRNRYFLDDGIPIFTLVTLMGINAFIILRNAREIDKKGELYIKLGFNLL